MVQLSEIVDGVLTLTGRSAGDSAFYQFVYKNLDVRRVQQPPAENAHIVNPLNNEMGGFKAREVPLTGAEQIYGDYLTLQFGTHDDAVYLLNHASLDDLEKQLISDGGVFNPFVDWIYAVIRGRVQKYSAIFQQDGQSVVFSKDAQFACAYGNKGSSDLKPYIDRQIEWSDPPETGP
ncbi:MAG: hypothetical protein KDA88_00785 [Planctomycetaceae bacterium]|nr:hypothetical protein [Planctomycetaceae bacterium]